VGGDLSVRETEALAREVNLDQPGEESEHEVGRHADVLRLEEAFRQALGTRVRLVVGRGGAGRLVINFYSEDELQGLYDAIVGGG
jgi:ParB family chromosome partitioning protein